MRAAGILLACLAARALAAEPALAFRPDALQVSLRLAVGGDGRAHPEHRLTLVADLPRDRAVLRLAEPRFEPVRADTGELLGLLVRPGSRVQQVASDRNVRRERLLRLALDLTPPRAPVRSLHDLRGTVQVTVGSGSAEPVAVALRPAPAGPVAVPGLDGGSLRVESAEGRRVALVLSPALAERLAEVELLDAGGADLPARAPQTRAVEDGTRLQFEAEAGEPAAALVRWHPVLRIEAVAIAVAQLDVPGGIPGIGGAGAPPAPPPAYRPPQVRQPLHAAVVAGDAAGVRRVIAADPAALERAEGDGRRPLHRAIVLGRADLAEILLAAGADAQARTREGSFTALDLAAAGGDAACAALLLARGADRASVIPGNGWSALHQAVNVGSPVTVQVLLAAGADPWLQGKDGRSPIDLARDQGRWPELRLLLGNPP